MKLEAVAFEGAVRLFGNHYPSTIAMDNPRDASTFELDFNTNYRLLRIRCLSGDHRGKEIFVPAERIQSMRSNALAEEAKQLRK